MITARAFALEQAQLVWKWLQEFPEANFDDYGPQTFADFMASLEERMQRERIWIFHNNDVPCGVVSYLPITTRMGTLHGVCFAAGRCSQHEKREALAIILSDLLANGSVEKICAAYFADNTKIARFLADLGAVREGYFSRHTVRNGQPLDMVQVAIFRE